MHLLKHPASIPRKEVPSSSPASGPQGRGGKHPVSPPAVCTTHTCPFTHRIHPLPGRLRTPSPTARRLFQQHLPSPFRCLPLCRLPPSTRWTNPNATSASPACHLFSRRLCPPHPSTLAPGERGWASAAGWGGSWGDLGAVEQNHTPFPSLTSRTSPGPCLQAPALPALFLGTLRGRLT